MGLEARLGQRLSGGAVAVLVATCSHMPQYSGEKGVRLAQKMQAGPCIRVGVQLQKAEVGPSSGSTWRLSH